MYIPSWLGTFGEQRKKEDKEELEYKAKKRNHKLIYKKVKWFDGLKKK